MFAVALPDPSIRKIGYMIGVASWAMHHAIEPPSLNHELAAVLEIAEKLYRFQQRFGSIIGVYHGQNCTLNHWVCQVLYLVYYEVLMDSLTSELLGYGRKIVAELKLMNASLVALHNEVEAISKQEKPKYGPDNQPRSPIVSVLTTHHAIKVDAKTREHKDILQRAFEVFQVIGVGAVVVYAGLTYRMWEDTARSANAAEETARLSYHQTILAGNSLKASSDNFRLDQRAWVSATKYSLSAEPTISGTCFVTLHLVNNGKTPALRVWSFDQDVHIWTLSSGAQYPAYMEMPSYFIADFGTLNWSSSAV
jgi:hypothetical protein